MAEALLRRLMAGEAVESTLSALLVEYERIDTLDDLGLTLEFALLPYFRLFPVDTPDSVRTSELVAERINASLDLLIKKSSPKIKLREDVFIPLFLRSLAGLTGPDGKLDARKGDPALLASLRLLGTLLSHERMDSAQRLRVLRAETSATGHAVALLLDATGPQMRYKRRNVSSEALRVLALLLGELRAEIPLLTRMIPGVSSKLAELITGSDYKLGAGLPNLAYRVWGDFLVASFANELTSRETSAELSERLSGLIRTVLSRRSKDTSVGAIDFCAQLLSKCDASLTRHYAPETRVFDAADELRVDLLKRLIQATVSNEAEESERACTALSAWMTTEVSTETYESSLGPCLERVLTQELTSLETTESIRVSCALIARVVRPESTRLVLETRREEVLGAWLRARRKKTIDLDSLERLASLCGSLHGRWLMEPILCVLGENDALESSADACLLEDETATGGGLPRSFEAESASLLSCLIRGVAFERVRYEEMLRDVLSVSRRRHEGWLTSVVRLAEGFGESFREYLVDALFPVLECLSDPRASFVRATRRALEDLARICAYDSTSELISENLDYVVNEIVFRLTRWRGEEDEAEERVLEALLRELADASTLHALRPSLDQERDGLKASMSDALISGLMRGLDDARDSSERVFGLLSVLERVTRGMASTTTSRWLSSETTLAVDRKAQRDEFHWEALNNALSECYPEPQAAPVSSLPEEDNDDEPEETPQLQETPTHYVLEKACHFMSHPEPTIQRVACRTTEACFLVLSQRDPSSLPNLVHRVWPALMESWREIERPETSTTPHRVRALAEMIHTCAKTTRDFASSRVERDVWPALERRLTRTELRDGTEGEIVLTLLRLTRDLMLVGEDARLVSHARALKLLRATSGLMLRTRRRFASLNDALMEVWRAQLEQSDGNVAWWWWTRDVEGGRAWETLTETERESLRVRWRWS